MTSVVVFDYGFGNVRSMVRALANLGLDTTLTSDYRQALEADGMVVPGVGAFAACMTGLREVSGDRVILDRLRTGRPVLGVCVGEQIMFERGNEHADTTEGLGLIGGTVDLLDADVVPHMGWDTVEAPSGSALLEGVENERFYFVHSYAAMSATAKDLSAEQVDLPVQIPPRFTLHTFEDALHAVHHGTPLGLQIVERPAFDHTFHRAAVDLGAMQTLAEIIQAADRKSTRLNSSH